MALTLTQMKAQFQDPMRQGIVEILWKSSRVMQFLTFIQNAGLAYHYRQNAKLPGVATRALNTTFTRTAGVTRPAVETLSILGGAIRTDSIQIALKGGGARTNSIGQQIKAAAKMFDRLFFHGNTQTDPNAFLGLKNRIGAGKTVTNSANGAVVAWEKVVELQDQVEGDNAGKILWMNQTNRRNLSNDAAADAGGKGLRDVGTQFPNFNGSRIVEIFYDETETAILPFNETCGSSNVCSSIYCTQMGGEIDEESVQGLSGLPGDIQATGPFDYGEYQEDVVQMVAGLGIFSQHCAARLEGCKAS